MNQTSKSALRRAKDPAFVQRYFAGVGIDIDAGTDRLSAYAHLFPRLEGLLDCDGRQGDVVQLTGVPADAFDFVHVSDCLDGVPNPAQALARWLEAIKPGGYLILTVPDEDHSETGMSPASPEVDHKTRFTIHKPQPATPNSVNVLDLVIDAARVASCERLVLIREHDDEAQPQLDPMPHGAGECAIEVVLRKRVVPRPVELFEAIDRAGNEAEAIERCRQALELYPYHFETYRRTSVELLRHDRTSVLEALWSACVQRLPNEHSARLYSALGLVALGKLNEGFQQREAFWTHIGWHRRTTAEPPDYPAWKGEVLEGKSIVIWSEFGLGDEMFFFRFARILREQCGAAHVSVVCQASLVDLFRASGEANTVCAVEDSQTLAAHDYWVYPHAIPAWLPLDIERLPAVVPYLRAPGGSAAPIVSGTQGALKVGVVFKGAPTHENDSYRSLPSLALLDSLFALDGVEFYLLQKGEGEEQAAQYAARLPNVHNLAPRLRTFNDTANAVDALDLLIGVDTSLANLAGAMGKPVWLMLPMIGDWRWHYVREDSPWYSSARLFRQKDAGWPEVVDRIRDALIRLRDREA